MDPEVPQALRLQGILIGQIISVSCTAYTEAPDDANTCI